MDLEAAVTQWIDEYRKQGVEVSRIDSIGTTKLKIQFSNSEMAREFEEKLKRGELPLTNDLVLRPKDR